MIPKKGAYSSFTDLISVRLDQGVVPDHTTPNKWSIIGTNLYKVSRISTKFNPDPAY